MFDLIILTKFKLRIFVDINYVIFSQKRWSSLFTAYYLYKHVCACGLMCCCFRCECVHCCGNINGKQYSPHHHHYRNSPPPTYSHFACIHLYIILCIHTLHLVLFLTSGYARRAAYAWTRVGIFQQHSTVFVCVFVERGVCSSRDHNLRLEY